ncbi:MAG: FliI/YscN family ATPase [Phycisphaerales bacterium]|nr:FliI/YscN family ATPase [Phycisphaerales bacterium]
MAVVGRIEAVRGLSLLVRDLPAPVGSLVHLPELGPRQSPSAVGEVVGFSGLHTIVMMLGQTTGIRSGDRVVALHSNKSVAVGRCMLGRVLNGLGEPIDGGPVLHDLLPQPLDPSPLPSMSRSRITAAMPTGVRAIDLMTTLGRGQRIGLFAGPGVGKSTLLGSITRGCASDVNVVALIGERGREVKDFIEHSLGKTGLARSVVIVATGDESPLMRIRAAMSACAVAEFFRDHGMSVMLMMDSVTRFAHAQRQVGLSAGEPPASKGYTPSVFSAMARLLERAGAVAPSLGGGAITGLYTVLVEGDDMTEPVADAARGILDGHIILSRSLAQKGHYPAIDVLDSVSRVADEVTDATHQAARRQLVRLLALYREVEDLVQIGAYAKGANAETDLAIGYHGRINELLRQDKTADRFEDARAKMIKLALESGNAQQNTPGARRSA